MKASAGLLLVCILGMVLVAPPAYPQKVDEKTLLNNLSVDMINLKNTLKQMQDASDHRNAEMTKLLQDMVREVSTRFGSMDTTIQKLNESLAGIRTSDEKSVRDLQEVRTSLETLKKTVDDGFVQLNSKSTTLTRQLNDMKSTEQQLPGAAQVFQQAYGELDAGFPDLAIGDFREFLKNYPADIRASAAQYYIGDALFSQKKLDQALVEFDFVLTKYPGSEKKCSALYRKGQVLVELKQIPQARAALQNVGKECPNTQEAANAAADLKKLPATRGQ
jgi:tol-pal system protein YbgF